MTRGPQELGGSEDTIARAAARVGTRATTLSVTFGAMHTDSESDGSPTDMTFFNMAPVCPLDPTNPFYCLQGNYADWVSDFLENSGQSGCGKTTRGSRPTTTRCRTGASSTTPNPDWDDLCRQWNKSDYTQVDANIDWQISDRLSFLSTTGISEFSSSGVSDWQLMGMEFRPSGVESEVLYQEFQFNLISLDGRVDLITGVNYFNEDSGSPRESLINAFGSSNYANNATGGAANGNLWGCNDTLGVPCAGHGAAAAHDRRRLGHAGIDGVRPVREQHDPLHRAAQLDARRPRVA